MHPEFQQGEAYHNLVTGFRNPVVTGAYIVAVGALAFHLHHGVWSMFQTLGASNPRYNHLRRPLAAAIAVVTFVGFASVPISIQLGIIS